MNRYTGLLCCLGHQPLSIFTDHPQQSSGFASKLGTIEKRGKSFERFADISEQLNRRRVVVFDIRGNDVDVNEWSLFVLVPMRRPILDRIIADSKDQIRGVQECVCWLVGYLPNPAAEVCKLLAGYGSRSLESS